MSNPFEDRRRSETAAACRMFAGDDAELLDHLFRHSQSPLQVPFRCLDLLRARHFDGIPEEELAPHGYVEDPEEVDMPLGRVASPRKPTPEEVELAYRMILQRVPESQTTVGHHVAAAASVEQMLVTLLCSPEATANLPRFFARAFPQARRLWHVHIPKTAGSSFFASAKAGGWGFLNTNVLMRAVSRPARMTRSLRLDPESPGSGIVSGHWKLPHFLDAISPFDHVIVFVRDPVQRFVSEYNYAVDVVSRHANVHVADPNDFLARGLDPESFTKTYERGFFRANVQASYLSAEGTCEAALRNLAACDTSLLPSDAADQAIAGYFPGASREWVNVSNKYIRSLDVSPALREEILVKCHHDHVLHEVARRRFREARSTAAGSAAADRFRDAA